MSVRELIAKIESNRLDYIVYANQCKSELSVQYETKPHPDGRSLIVSNITSDVLNRICKRYRCSGMMIDDATGVVTNFGYYD